MNILILGSGGREHALAWKTAQSPLCDKLYVAPGNGGTAENLPVKADDFKAVRTAVLEKKIGMVIVGPEAPLVAGIADYFAADPALKNVTLIGPGAKGAQLEGSKAFAKAFMHRNDIPTAQYRAFTKESFRDAVAYLKRLSPPYVLKASGLAAGKGVVICPDTRTAEAELGDMLLQGKFGEASSSVVIEEFLSGIEFSVFVLTDGQDYKILPLAKDYKRIGESDTGPNTGGMGAVSPVPFVDAALMEKVEKRIIVRTLAGLRKEGIPYLGFIYFGLMNVKGDPYVIEYNVRMGDPETEAVIPRIKSGLPELFLSAREGKLPGYKMETDERAAATVVLASKGYPDKYRTGMVISGLDGVRGSLVFHAGTARNENGETVASGGRVLAVTALASTHAAALKACYDDTAKIGFEGCYYRKDIGKDVIENAELKMK